MDTNREIKKKRKKKEYVYKIYKPMNNVKRKKERNKQSIKETMKK